MSKVHFGLVGLGTMGSALALNIAENGFPIAVITRKTEVADAFMVEAGPLAERILNCGNSIPEFVAAMDRPRNIILMVPAGPIVDQVIEEYAPLLQAGDTIIDAGNANFHDTRRRTDDLAARGLNFIGMGVSGGEYGARTGPSMMIGGDPSAFAPIQEMIEAIAALFEGEPCAAHVGPVGAGPFVKTVHNGIEYADMQLLAEVWGLMRDGMIVAPADAGAVMTRWNDGPLKSYLVEISGKVLAAKDSKTGKPVVDIILDRAGQKGTGRWTVIEALSLGQSASSIEAAVGARSWSSQRDVRAAGAAALGGNGSVDVSHDDLEAALLAGRILSHAQGFELMQAASDEYSWDIDMARVAEIWRAGCIIRSALLDDISEAYRDGLPHGRLWLAPRFAGVLKSGTDAMRRVLAAAIAAGLPMPAMSATLAWYDTMRQARGTTDLIQAQRDFFGAHSFERVDAEGAYHGPWWD